MPKAVKLATAKMTRKASPKATAKSSLKAAQKAPLPQAPVPGASADVLDRLWSVVVERRSADPTVSHSARLLQRGTAKVAQKFGEEAVECLIEAVAGNRTALVGESADV
ncbi:MAG: phosphoribosyl-ATP diphosphatase, partial [Janthinobacterium lividum]